MRLGPLLACPACTSENRLVTLSRDALTCRQCDTRFPIIQCGTSRIPWLFPEPDTAWLEWKARYNGFLQSNSAQQERLRKALSKGRNSRTGRRRISRLLQARKQYRHQVAEILAPLGLEHIDWPSNVSDLLHDKLPKNQGLSMCSSPFANSVEALAEMVVLNYLGLHGEEAMFGMVLDNPGLGTGAVVEPYIAFNAIV